MKIYILHRIERHLYCSTVFGEHCDIQIAIDYEMIICLVLLKIILFLLFD